MSKLASMYTHLLVATDGSESCLHTVEVAAVLARQLSARLTICYVSTPYSALVLPAFPGPGALLLDDTDFRRRSQQRREQVLAPVVARAAQLGVAAQTVSREHARPWSALLQAAEAVHADCIVARTGEANQQLLAHAGCAVLMVP